MFRFDRAKLLPLFLKLRITVKELAVASGINQATAQKALDGKTISAPSVDKICAALKINALDFLVED